jgi:glycosyltransferase involved in cell wall biosynthesis
MKILLLSAYDAVSHQYWRKALVSQFPEATWCVLTLPARYFSWRLRGNSLSWGFSERSALEADYDLVITTSMTDLTALRGFVPKLAQLPTLVYFHENQFAYPKSGHEVSSVEPQILNLYTALVGDRVLFNTHFNRDSFIAGCKALLKKLPDQIPSGITEQLEARSAVLPVPLPDAVFMAHQPQCGALQIIWNHRWEFDKGPGLLYQALVQLRQRVGKSVNWKLHLVGQQFRKMPAVFEQIQAEFADNMGEVGFMVSASQYRQLLARCDVVLSTALHDFQGIAVLEGVAAGCIPVVPDRLAYPELLGSDYCYGGGPDEAHHLAQRLQDLMAQKAQQRLPTPPEVESLRWSELRASYWAEIETAARAAV